MEEEVIAPVETETQKWVRDSSVTAPVASAEEQENDDIFDDAKRAVGSHTDQVLMRTLELEEVFPDFETERVEEKNFLKAVAGLDAKGCQKLLMQFRSTFRYFHADVSSDVNQPIIIDGDSLVLEVLLHSSIDDKFFQPLPCLFLLERLLESFAAGGRQVHVVFLDELASIWTSPNSKWLRKLAVHHVSRISKINENLLASLGSDESQILVAQTISRIFSSSYKNFADPEFLHFVKRLSPELYLVGDGVCCYEEIDSKPVKLELAEAEPRFIALTLALQMERIQVARLTEVEFSSRRITGFYVSVPKSTLVKWRAISSIYQPIFPLEDITKQSELFSKIHSLVGDSHLRLSVCATACHSMLLKSNNVQFVKLVLLHAYLLPTLPLTHRAHSFLQMEPVLNEMFDEFSCNISAVSTHLPESFWNSEDVSIQTALADLWDCRLIYTLASISITEEVKLLNEVFDVLCKSSGVVATFYPFSAPLVSKPVVNQVTELDIPLFSFPFAAGILPQVEKVAEIVKIEEVKVADDDDWESALDETVQEEKNAAVVEAPAASTLTEKEVKELTHWKSNVIINDVTFERQGLDEATMFHSAKYSSYMERFSKTLKGDSRFVPWEVVMGVLEVDAQEHDEKKEKKSYGGGGGGKAKQSTEGGSKADQIRRANAMEKYKELMTKIDTDLKHSDDSYSDVEVGSQYIIERLLIHLPKEMSKIKTLMASLGASGKLSPQEEDAPALKYMSKLIDYAYKAWMKLLQDLTTDPSTAALAAAAIAILSGQTPATSFDFSGTFPQPLVLPNIAIAEPAPSNADKNKKKTEKQQDSSDESGDEKSNKKKDDKPKKRIVPQSKASQIVAAAASVDSGFGTNMLVSTSLAKRTASYNPMDLASVLLQYLSYVWRRYKESATIDQIRQWIAYLQWLGFSPMASSLASSMKSALSGSSKKEKDKKQQPASLLDETVLKQRGSVLFNILDRASLKKEKGAPESVVTGPLHPLDPCRFSFVRFQLQCGGYRLPRNVGSIPDSRTAKFGFWPDKWQWNLLNIVDAGQSALAPTSAGKSFISYYVIEKVLEDNKKAQKSSDLGIVVVVLPTKALVNQVSAVIYQKYGDIFGIYTDPNTKIKVLQCQVLITLPTQFESLLMCASTYEWSHQIHYAIFDEVHCIGDSIEGVKWEHLLTMLETPFVALSATVGNRSQFHNFLQSVQTRHSRKVELITYEQRWSDLQYFIYLPSVKSDNEWTVKYTSELISYRRGLLKQFAEAESLRNSHSSSTMYRLLEASANRGLFCEDLLTLLDEFKPAVNTSIFICCVRLLEVAVMRHGTMEVLNKIQSNSLFDHCEKLKSTIQTLLERNNQPAPMELFLTAPTKDGVWARQSALGPQNLVAIHPCAAISISGAWNPQQGFPADLPFSAQDTVQLFDMMKRVTLNLPSVQAQLDAISPESLFPDQFLSKRDVAKLKEELQRLLKEWSQSSDPTVRNAVSSVFAEFEAQVNSRVVDQPISFSSMQRRQVEIRFFSMLCELNAADKLPAIVFNFERVICDHLCNTIVETLEMLEKSQNHAELDPLLEKSKQKLLSRQMKETHRKRDAEVNEKEAEEEKRTAAMMGDDEKDLVLTTSDDIDERFSFVLTKDRLNEADMKWWMDRVNKKIPQWGRSHFLIRALKRGVGVHHEGLPKAYRDLVECLFRGRHIRVVIATGTLAFGVNMPCRSTIFALDSPSLTPLMFRQMSGRAGRRGYDDVGNVVFFALPHWRVSKLMTTHLPSLRGQFPVSTTFITRSLVYYLQVDKSSSVSFSAALRSLLTQPLACFGLPSDQSHIYSHMLLTYFRYSLHQLSSEHHIDALGALQPYSSLLSSLSEAEPFNIAFISLLSSGILRKTCVSSVPADALRNLLLLVCHVLIVVPLSAAFLSADIPKTASKVILDPLPNDLESELRDYNLRTLKTYIDMCRAVAKETGNSKRFTLPLSGYTWPLNHTNGLPVPELSKLSLLYEARSPFMALCGLTDSYSSARDLVDTVQTGLNLPYRSIPVLEHTTFRGLNLRKNAYAFDFYKHQQLSVLMNANSMRRTAVWAALRSTRFLLSNLAAFFEQLSVKSNDTISTTISLLSTEFGEALDSGAWSDLS